MKAKIPVIVKDPEVSDFKDIAPTEEITVEETTFLDGPVSTTVAVLDFDPASGALTRGVPWLAGAGGQEGRYVLDRPFVPGGTIEPSTAAVSVFGAVHKTIQMFEEKDALGRQVRWAFGAPQLLVVPRAGEWANAYYERESHSVQLFHFLAPGGQRIFTCHSQDIVAHETAHAVLDGIAPDLYGAVTPQALAIHEAVADMAALLCSLRCRELTRRVLDQTGGDIRRSSVLSGLAEQFAGGLGRGTPFLRDLDNDRSLCPSAPPERRVDRSEPHALSEVLTGALYRTLQVIYAQLRAEYEAAEVADENIASRAEQAYVADRVEEVVPRGSRSAADARAKALFVASERLKRMLFRGLDYLPPGDVTFADLGRAIFASDEAAHPQSSEPRDALARELAARCVVAGERQLHVRTNYRHRALEGIDLQALVDSDYVAYEFANRNRELLHIPKGIPFEVRPRLDVTKLYWHRGDARVEARECLFKVGWTEVEDNDVGRGLPRQRRRTAGTTLALEWSDAPRIKALLTTRRTAQERRDTDAMIRSLVDADVLQMGDAAFGPNGVPLRGVVPAEAPGGVLRIRFTGRMLHIAGER